MDDSSTALPQQAILAALSSNWKEALKLNQQILAEDPDNVEALNRLARTYFELGNLSLSKKYFEATLEYDPYNQIATKFIKRIAAFRKKSAKNPLRATLANNIQLDGDIFIEEPGKTKLVTLLKVAEPQKLSLLFPGMPVVLIKKNRGITVTDQNNQYLGVLPDDIAHRLLYLMGGNNKYQAYIKTLKLNSLSILIKEIYRSLRFKNQPSFLDNLNAGPTYSSNIVLRQDQEESDFLSEEESEDEVI